MKAASTLETDPQQRKRFEQWRKASLAFLKRCPDGWATPSPEVALRMKDTNAVAQTNFSVAPDGTARFSESAKERTTLTLQLSNQWSSAIRLEILPQHGQEAKTPRINTRNG